MNLVDSSAWLEYFANGENAEFFSKVIENTAELIVPTICLYEVYKRICLQSGEAKALSAIASMMQGQIVALDSKLALSAAKMSLEEKLHMADSILLTTAHANNAIFWTQDADFKDVPGVQYKVKN
jgi:predicted nucleic acid-binding protein